MRESIPVKQQQEQEEPIPKEHSSSNERAARDPTVLSGEGALPFVPVLL